MALPNLSNPYVERLWHAVLTRLKGTPDTSAIRRGPIPVNLPAIPLFIELLSTDARDIAGMMRAISVRSGIISALKAIEVGENGISKWKRRILIRYTVRTPRDMTKRGYPQFILEGGRNVTLKKFLIPSNTDFIRT